MSRAAAIARGHLVAEQGYMVAYADGASRGNPGPAAFGVFLPAEDFRYGEVLPFAATNNVAEYHGAIRALKFCRERGARAVEIRLDSLLVVKQARGEYRVKHPDLLPLYEELKREMEYFDQLKFVHVYRELNTEADRAADDALDLMTQ
jgi:ribonuclease HI